MSKFVHMGIAFVAILGATVSVAGPAQAQASKPTVQSRSHVASRTVAASDAPKCKVSTKHLKKNQARLRLVLSQDMKAATECAAFYPRNNGRVPRFKVRWTAHKVAFKRHDGVTTTIVADNEASKASYVNYEKVVAKAHGYRGEALPFHRHLAGYRMQLFVVDVLVTLK